MAVCVAAVSFALHSIRQGHSMSRTRGVSAENSPMSSAHGSARDSVPEACPTLSAEIADRLAPGAERSEVIHATEADHHTECAWTLFGSERSRQLTLELRAVGASGGRSAVDVASSTFQQEWQSDRDGKDLADTAKVKDSRGVSGIGEQAYVVYTLDATDGIGEAIADARLANLLVTVHYSGGDDRDSTARPLSSDAATGGALSVARDVITKLESQS
jgi:hypothetical protein